MVFNFIRQFLRILGDPVGKHSQRVLEQLDGGLLEEKEEQINFLELQAVPYGLKCFANHLNNCNILLKIDNTAAIA